MNKTLPKWTMLSTLPQSKSLILTMPSLPGIFLGQSKVLEEKMGREMIWEDSADLSFTCSDIV